MRRLKPFALLAAAFVVLALAAAPAHAASKVTVGQFLIEIAKVRNLAATDASAAESALRGAGVRLPALDLGKELTQGDVAVIASAAGLDVTTSRPDTPYTQSQVDSFITSFGSVLGPTIGHDTHAKGKQPKTPKSKVKFKKKKKKKRKKKKTPKDPA